VDNRRNPAHRSATLPHRGSKTGRHAQAGSGAGPGVITPDGCAVDLYALLPPMGEPEIVHAAIPEGASILELDLARRFDAVLLASFLVNVPDDRLRGRFLQACRRHVRDGGWVLVQRHQPAWFEEAAEDERTADGITFRLRDVRRPEPGLLAATVEYQVEDRVWIQWFCARRLDDTDMAAALAEAGLAVDAYLTGDGSWVRAVPASPGAAPGRSPR
jgi:hypothetical protein